MYMYMPLMNCGGLRVIHAWVTVFVYMYTRLSPPFPIASQTVAVCGGVGGGGIARRRLGVVVPFKRSMMMSPQASLADGA